jgi:hypothetical protein
VERIRWGVVIARGALRRSMGSGVVVLGGVGVGNMRPGAVWRNGWDAVAGVGRGPVWGARVVWRRDEVRISSCCWVDPRRAINSKTDEGSNVGGAAVTVEVEVPVAELAEGSSGWRAKRGCPR